MIGRPSEGQFWLTVLLEVVFVGLVVWKIVKGRRARLALVALLVVAVPLEWAAFDALVGFGRPVATIWTSTNPEFERPPVGIQFVELRSPKIGWPMVRLVAIEKGYHDQIRESRRNEAGWIFFPTQILVAGDAPAVLVSGEYPVPKARTGVAHVILRDGYRGHVETAALADELWALRDELTKPVGLAGRLGFTVVSDVDPKTAESKLWARLRALDRSKMDTAWRKFLELE